MKVEGVLEGKDDEIEIIWSKETIGSKIVWKIFENHLEERGVVEFSKFCTILQAYSNGSEGSNSFPWKSKVFDGFFL